MSADKETSIVTVALVGAVVYLLLGRRAALPMPMPQQYGQQVMQGAGYTPVIGAYARSPAMAGSIQQQAQVVRQSQSNAWGAVGGLLGRLIGSGTSSTSSSRGFGQSVAGVADAVAAPRLDTWGQDDAVMQDAWAASPAVDMAADDPAMYDFYG